MPTERKIIATYGSGYRFETEQEAMKHVTPFIGKVIDHTDLGGRLHWYMVKRCTAKTFRDGTGNVWATLQEVPFRRCRKLTLIEARQLTLHNFRDLEGSIHTPEGPAPFRPGDYLARDAIGVYPMRNATLEDRQRYCKVKDESDSWATYEPLDIREAAQIPNTFVLNGQQGKAGDYIVRRGERMWIVDRAQFERTYQFLGK